MPFVACQSVHEQPSLPLLPDEGMLQEIVYISTAGDVRTVNRTGTVDVPVARLSSLGEVEAARFTLATWSPDGRRIAFVSTFQREEEAVRSELYVADPAAGQIVPVLDTGETPPFFLSWSPDSRRISFLSVDEDSGTLAMQVVGDNGGDYTVVGTGRPYYWDWSPTSDSIFAHVGGVDSLGRRSSSLRVIGVENGNISSETLGLETIAFQAPEYSPDGRYIAAAVEDLAGRRNLVILTPDGQPVRSIATISGQVAFSWSPDGNHIAYIDGRPGPLGGVAGRLRIARTTAAPQTIDYSGPVLDAPAVAAFFWSPDGEKLAYFEPVVVSDRRGRPRIIFRMLVHNVEQDETVAIGPFLPTNSFRNQLVPYFDQYERSITLWSPDSEFVVINAVTGDRQPGIFVVPADGESAPQRVAEGSFPFWAPR